jgi:hypothetical protein
MHPLAAVPVMAIPIVITVAGVAAQLVYAWYDPDFYQQLWWDADLDERTSRLNNDWHNLWRSARSHGFTSADVEMANLDATMGRWWAWKGDLDKAQLRRAFLPFGRDWDEELDRWSEAFHRHVLVLTRANPEVRAELEARGVDPDRDYPVREPVPRWVVAGLVTAGLFVTGLATVAWIATRRRN